MAASTTAAFPHWSLAAMPSGLTVFELRQYTLHRGRRDELIELFEHNFIAPQNAVGAHVLGTFRDLDDPDRFVWMRGFDDMVSRKAALEAFYGGEVWKAHRNAANATIIDSDNVLLLKPALEIAAPLNSGARTGPPGVIRVTIHALRTVSPPLFTTLFESAIFPVIAAHGARPLTQLVTEPAPNTFPRLPVREHESLFIWIARFPDTAAEREFSTQLARESGWRDGLPDAVLPALMSKPEVLRLVPTATSPFH